MIDASAVGLTDRELEQRGTEIAEGDLGAEAAAAVLPDGFLTLHLATTTLITSQAFS